MLGTCWSIGELKILPAFIPFSFFLRSVFFVKIIEVGFEKYHEVIIGLLALGSMRKGFKLRTGGKAL